MDIIIKKPNETEKAEMQTKPIWECEISEFNWHYDSEETCLLVEGEVKVTYDGGSVSFGAGDMVTFPKGLSCVWNVMKPVKKHYVVKFKFIFRYFIDSFLIFNEQFEIDSVRFYAEDKKNNYAEIEIEYPDEEVAMELSYEKIQKILNAMSALHKIKFRPTLVYSSKEENGKHYVSKNLPCTVTIVKDFPEDSTGEVNQIYELSKNDKNVADVLHLYNIENYKTYVNLYKICEIINSDEIGRRLIDEMGLRKKYKLFTHTANNPKGVGVIEARHGFQKELPPELPMSVDEAEQLTHALKCEWISKKLGK